MSYKNNASSNRDALFGSAGKSRSSKSGESKSRTTASKPAPTNTSKGYNYEGKRSKPTQIGLTGEAKEVKMKEAEDYKEKAKKAMQKGLFSKPDPLAASTYYKRAADAYQQCGEARLERHFRISSADCQARVSAWATAAAEYTRAAELYQVAEDETLEMKREIGRRLHLSAADAFRNMGEPSKAASSSVQAALALIWGDESRLLPKVALQAIEEAVESHVPDPLNPYSRYRQTGNSAYIDPESDETAENPSQEALELARSHLIDRPYAHESVQEVAYLLIGFGEYASALYAAGAATVILSNSGVSTLTLSRAFVAETIITLAMGDPVAAEETFLNRHVQQSSYLTSRECKLAEDLFRAVKMRDPDALEEARSVKGSNRAAIGNLPEVLRELVQIIRLSGVARKGAVDTSDDYKKAKKSEPKVSLEEVAKQKTGYEAEAGDDGEAEVIDAGALQDELDALDFGDDESDLDDDDIDLR
eukprot:Nitzschia sp. Nitz4//scaffold4_size323378//144723//146150//NITZ4_000659-RA/size323378-processed-gene-0.283-mRNA-1//1//CDS//3329553396//2034//frame0